MAEQLSNNETETKQQNGDGVHNQILGSADVQLKSSLLVVVGEPFNVEQKDLILERIVIELSAWDVDQSKCDLNQQLSSCSAFQSSNQEAEKRFEHESPELHASILINPSLESTVATVTDFLTRPSTYKYLLHSGPVLQNNGAWLLQDGAFTFHHFQEIVKKLDLQGGEGSVVGDVSLVEKFADWNDALLSKLAPKLKLRLSRPATSLKDETGLIKFSDNISTYLKPFSVADRMKPGDSIGSLNFEQPTCYIFPAGQGTSLVFGIEGFTMLIDGGYKRSCTFWEFVRHLNRIDCMMISRLTYDNIFGLLSFFEKKSTEKGGPDVGVVMLNVGDTRHKTPNPVANNNNGASGHTTSGLIVSIAEEGRLLAEHMSITHLAPPQPVIGSTVHPISLYYKVGHGSLDMYVISPTYDSKELKDYLNQWSKVVDSYKGGIPLVDHLSVSFALL
ncbi:hypothetical protein HELRODRAFT_100950, partial [Helobdella robusta]|uniref:Uncharacterized protein n=1 Tax=Helobdella robusta TaxID=6412 RepID=T1ED24_HELRO